MVTFTQLKDGSWGLRSSAKLELGREVDVETKAGKVRKATPVRELWNGPDRDGNDCWGYALTATDKQPAAATTCPHCGRRSDEAASGAPELKPGQDDLPF